MPLYMDLHKGLKGLTLEDAEKAHLKDEEIQDQLGVKYHKFYINVAEGTIFCLVEAPNKEACIRCHLNSHGHLPCEIVEVNPSDFTAVLGEGGVTLTCAAVHPDGNLDSAVRTILFTDIVNSTSLTEYYGDIIAMTILRKHNEIVRDSLQKNVGREIKHTGDGIMASFVSPSKAVRAALEIQESLKAYRQQSPNIPLHIKIGINAGEPITEGGDFFGVAVQLSKRICDLATADQVLISDIVKSLCMGRNFQMSALGAFELKGHKESTNIYEVLGYS